MTDYLIMLLSTDWFVPYWEEIGIRVAEEKKLGIQQGCRAIVDQIVDGVADFFATNHSNERKAATRAEFIAVVREWGADAEVLTTLEDWGSLSHNELNAIVECSHLNRAASRFEDSIDSASLESDIRTEVRNVWAIYDLDPSIFRNECLASETTWDIRIQRLLSNPRVLVNHLWRFLLSRRLRAFWAELRTRLTSEQLERLLSWYRATTKSALHEDRPELIPSFMAGGPGLRDAGR